MLGPYNELCINIIHDLLKLTPWGILIWTPYVPEEASLWCLYVPDWDSDWWILTGDFLDELINIRGIAA